MLIAWISTAVVWINLSHTDRRSWSQIILWSSAESRANHNLINAHHTQTSCREEQRGDGGVYGWTAGAVFISPFSSLLFQLAFSLISMHTASSPRILPREESCANFSASRATVSAADTADLENTNRTKKILFLPDASSLLSSYLHLPIPACLHLSISVKTLLKPPCPSLTLHCISTIPLSKPPACSDCIHFLLPVHPLSSESNVPLSLHPSVLCVNIYAPNYIKCFKWPHNYVVLVLNTVYMQATAAHRWAAAIFSRLDEFTDFCL